MVGMNSSVVDLTTLIGLSLATGSRVEEKVKLSTLGREQMIAVVTWVISQLVLAGSTSWGWWRRLSST